MRRASTRRNARIERPGEGGFLLPAVRKHKSTGSALSASKAPTGSWLDPWDAEATLRSKGRSVAANCVAPSTTPRTLAPVPCPSRQAAPASLLRRPPASPASVAGMMLMRPSMVPHPIGACISICSNPSSRHGPVCRRGRLSSLPPARLFVPASSSPWTTVTGTLPSRMQWRRWGCPVEGRSTTQEPFHVIALEAVQC